MKCFLSVVFVDFSYLFFFLERTNSEEKGDGDGGAGSERLLDRIDSLSKNKTKQKDRSTIFKTTRRNREDHHYNSVFARS